MAAIATTYHPPAIACEDIDRNRKGVRDDGTTANKGTNNDNRDGQTYIHVPTHTNKISGNKSLYGRRRGTGEDDEGRGRHYTTVHHSLFVDGDNLLVGRLCHRAV